MTMLWLALAWAASPPDLTSELARGVTVNWTRGVVVVEAGSYRAGAQAAKAVEQSARLAVDDRLAEELGEVPVRGDLQVAELLEGEALGPALAARRTRWRVVEATYAVSGKVDLRAELSLQDFLKPWTLTLAEPTPPVADEGRHSGLVVDVRGAGQAPVFAPALVGPDGAPVWAGALYDEDAVTTAPCVWVSDPEHPAVAERVGEHPLRVRVASARDGRLTLSAADAAEVRAMVGTQALGQGRVVVVTDP